MLATGGRARKLPAAGGGEILTLRTRLHAERIRAAMTPNRRIVCIGAGVIGLEVAASARARGCSVDVIEMVPTVMGRCVGQEIASWIAGLHERHGVALHLRAAVDAVEPGRVVFGGVVGRGMAGAGKPYDEIPWFWTDQHAVNLQMAGTLHGAQHIIGIDQLEPGFIRL